MVVAVAAEAAAATAVVIVVVAVAEAAAAVVSDVSLGTEDVAFGLLERFPFTTVSPPFILLFLLVRQMETPVSSKVAVHRRSHRLP